MNQHLRALSHILSVPTEDMDPKRLNGVKWQLELLKRAFGLTEINFDSMIGREGYAMLTLDNDPEYGEQNRIQKFIVGA
jgi:hypothetical protein